MGPPLLQISCEVADEINIAGSYENHKGQKKRGFKCDTRAIRRRLQTASDHVKLWKMKGSINVVAAVHLEQGIAPKILKELGLFEMVKQSMNCDIIVPPPASTTSTRRDDVVNVDSNSRVERNVSSFSVDSFPVCPESLPPRTVTCDDDYEAAFRKMAQILKKKRNRKPLTLKQIFRHWGSKWTEKENAMSDLCYILNTVEITGGWSMPKTGAQLLQVKLYILSFDSLHFCLFFIPILHNFLSTLRYLIDTASYQS